MIYEELESAKKFIMSKDKILLLTHQKMDADGLSSMLVLGILLGRLGKEVKIVSSDPVPEILEFLPFIEKVTVANKAAKDFVITIKKSDGLEIDGLRYDTDNEYLNIIITPKIGEIIEQNISFSRGLGNYDLIIVVDTGDLDHLGEIYHKNVEMFYNTPVVNIDHHISNTGYGRINIVDTTAASTTEIIFEFIKVISENWKEFIDEDIATLLMTGLISDTGSFKYSNTSPKSLEMAADLMDFGARQQDIIRHLYKTKHMTTLKIWGKVLMKIKEDPTYKIVWSTVTKDDLKETGASPEETESIIDELMTNAPGAEIICLIKDSLEGIISVSLRSNTISIDVSEIAKKMGGGGHKQAAGFKIRNYKSFELEVAKFIEYLQNFQKERLGITDEEAAEISTKNDLSELATNKINNESTNYKETGIEFPKSLFKELEQDTEILGAIDGVLTVEKKKDTNYKGSATSGFLISENKESTKISTTTQKPEPDFNEKLPALEPDVSEKVKSPKKIKIKSEKISYKDENNDLDSDKKKKGRKKADDMLKVKITTKPKIEVLKKSKIKKEEVVLDNDVKNTKKLEDDVVIETKSDLDLSLPGVGEIEKEVEKSFFVDEGELKSSDSVEKLISDVESEVQPVENIKTEPAIQQVQPDISQAINNQPQVQSIQSEQIQNTQPLFEQQTNNQTQQVEQPVAQVQQEQISSQQSAQNGGLVSAVEADRYARRFYELLQSTDRNSEEYKKYYDGYLYYAKIAGWNI